MVHNLATENPELTKQWHPTKNGDHKPEDISPNSHKKVWWKCTKGDDHEWEATVIHRSFGTGCPFCRSATSVPELGIFCELKTVFHSIQHRAMLDGFEVDIYIPELQFGIEYDGDYWHRDKKHKDLEKNEALNSKIFLIRVREQGLLKLSDNDIIVNPKNISLKLIKKISWRY